LHSNARRVCGRFDRRDQAEQDRVRKLAAAGEVYQEECRQREVEAGTRNEVLSRFIIYLAFDVESAIQDYVGVVLSNSVYPDTKSSRLTAREKSARWR